MVIPNESMPFSAYYSSSKRSGHSRRFRVTGDSGERNLSLEERGSDLGGVLEESGGEGEQVVGSGRSGGRERGSGAEVTRVVTRELTRERSRDHAGDSASPNPKC